MITVLGLLALSFITNAVAFVCPPDSYGYRCIDSKEPGFQFQWTNLTSTNFIFDFGDESMVRGLPIGFPFKFYDTTYDYVSASSNAYLTFDIFTDSTSYEPFRLPNNVDFPFHMIALWWTDLSGDGPGNDWIRYETVGTTPNRIFLIEYWNVPYYSPSNENINRRVTVQAKLFEFDNSIEIHILSARPNAGGAFATVGIENLDGSTGLTYYYGPTSDLDQVAVRFYNNQTNPNTCSPACLNNGNCTNPGTDQPCTCPDGFYGTHCQFTRQCDRTTCVDGQCGPFGCYCGSDRTGNECNIPVCNICYQGGCSGENCTCDPGVTGSFCNLGNACTNCVHGLCDFTDQTCHCDIGWTGENCTERTCDPVCVNGGTCRPDLSGCDCPTGYTGDCYTAICDQPCAQGGFCSQPGQCSCFDGWTGEFCELAACPNCNIQNGANCNNTEGICNCNGTGYSSNDCSVPICNLDCQNGGTCALPDYCVCPPGTAGVLCEIIQCPFPNECLHGGYCSAGLCECQGTGYAGPRCDIPLCPFGCSDGLECVLPGLCGLVANASFTLQHANEGCGRPPFETSSCILRGDDSYAYFFDPIPEEVNAIVIGARLIVYATSCGKAPYLVVPAIQDQPFGQPLVMNMACSCDARPPLVFETNQTILGYQRNSTNSFQMREIYSLFEAYTVSESCYNAYPHLEVFYLPSSFALTTSPMTTAPGTSGSRTSGPITSGRLTTGALTTGRVASSSSTGDDGESAASTVIIHTLLIFIGIIFM